MGSDFLRVDCSPRWNEELHLYRVFADFFVEIGGSAAPNDNTLCPLDPASYHVTVWDGLNDGNTQAVAACFRSKLVEFLSHLPDALLADEALSPQARSSPLTQRVDWSITLKLAELANWGNHAIVARLEPADLDSEKIYRWIEGERKLLSERFQEQFGVHVYWPYTPHVTLGYFANEEQTASSFSDMDRWNESMREKADGLTITFNSISLYGFTDMITFFKTAHSLPRGHLQA
jgi:hypothetical protein